jgi:hypothetical protein
MNDEGVLMEGDKVPEDRRMMEKGDTGDTAEQEKIDLEAEGIRLKKEQEKAELAEGTRLKKEQEKAELEAEGTRLKNEEEKIRNEQAEDRKALRLLEVEFPFVQLFLALFFFSACFVEQNNFDFFPMLQIL